MGRAHAGFAGFRFSVRGLMAVVVVFAVYNALFAWVVGLLQGPRNPASEAGNSLVVAVVWNVMVLLPFALVLMARRLGRSQASRRGPGWRDRPLARLSFDCFALWVGIQLDFVLLIAAVVGLEAWIEIDEVHRLALLILLSGHFVVLISLAVAACPAWIARVVCRPGMGR